MPIKPSIVLEGASRAADWIPFAQNMLRGMASDGTANFAPEDGITIVIFRHGSVAKISIHAAYPEGFKFAGTPYTVLNTSGWGSPYNEDNPQGTPGSTKKQDVIVEKDKGIWTAKRLPRYEPYYPDLQYGNMDWTSSDGKTVLTWDGPNSGQTCEMAYYLQTIGYCCQENIPANNWHKGYRYPGMVDILSASCHLVVMTPQRTTAVEDREPLDVESELFLGHNIYMNGEILITIAVGGEFNGEANLSFGAPLYVYGAAVQEVTDDEGEVTKYLVAMLSDYEIIEGGQYTSYKSAKDYLYRAPMDDLTNYELTDVGITQTGGGDYTDTPWSFNSTGIKAVSIRGHSSHVYEVRITDDGTVTSERLWDGNDKSRVGTTNRYDYTSPLNPGESNIWDAYNVSIVGVGYKDDEVRYAVAYSEFGGEVGLELDDPATGCDTTIYTKSDYTNAWFGFSYNPRDVKSDALRTHTQTEVFKEYTVGGTSGTATDPAVKRVTETEKTLKLPIFIDCRYDTVLFHNIKEHKNSFSYGFIVGATAFMMDELAEPQNYTWQMDMDLHIDGVVAFEGDTYTQSRHPGDCFTNSIYSLSSGKPCDQTGYLLYASIPQDDVITSAPSYVGYSGFLVAAFCNIQIHKTNPDKPDFDILFTARTKYSDPDAPSDSFIAHWDGEALTDRQDISTLLEIDNDGVLANTGKI